MGFPFSFGETEMGFELNIVPSKNTQPTLHPNSKGGTELMYYELKERIAPELFDQFNIILSRVRPESFDSRPAILWLHDLPEDPESQHLRDPKSRSRFAKIVFNSYWQQYDYYTKLGIPLEEGVVMKNAVEPFPSLSKPTDGPTRLIYFSTPHRGLHVLEAAIRVLLQHRDDFVVDVYSSFELYGWKERDREFTLLFDALKKLPCVNLHGTVSNAEIREALKTSHILAYPSTYIESSCRVAIESMCAGLLCVVPAYGALTETCTDYAHMYSWDPDPKNHVMHFANALNFAMDSVRNPVMQNLLITQIGYYNFFYGWPMRAAQWTNLLENLKNAPSAR